MLKPLNRMLIIIIRRAFFPLRFTAKKINKIFILMKQSHSQNKLKETGKPIKMGKKRACSTSEFVRWLIINIDDGIWYLHVWSVSVLAPSLRWQVNNDHLLSEAQYCSYIQLGVEEIASSVCIWCKFIIERNINLIILYCERSMRTSPISSFSNYRIAALRDCAYKSV